MDWSDADTVELLALYIEEWVVVDITTSLTVVWETKRLEPRVARELYSEGLMDITLKDM